MKKIKVFVISLVFLSSILLTATTLSAENLKIFCIDVDQGMSTLIVAPNGKSILIDCGGSGKQDAVYNVITKNAGLASVDYFICTHYHSDHYGCIKKLIEKGLTINEKFYDRDSENYLPEDKKKEGTEYYDYAVIAGKGNREYLRPGAKIDIDNSVEIQCFVVNGRVKNEYGPIDYPDEENGYSIGLLIKYNGFDFLIAGDITDDVEKKLVEKNILSDIDVYHVSHHGSETSSYSDFLNVIKPEVSIISCGSDQRYKHPRKTTVERLEKISPEHHIYQTNKNIKANNYPEIVKNVPNEFIGDLDCEGDEGTILVEVDADTYFVKLLDRDISNTYNIEN